MGQPARRYDGIPAGWNNGGVARRGGPSPLGPRQVRVGFFYGMDGYAGTWKMVHNGRPTTNTAGFRHGSAYSHPGRRTVVLIDAERDPLRHLYRPLVQRVFELARQNGPGLTSALDAIRDAVREAVDYDPTAAQMLMRDRSGQPREDVFLGEFLQAKRGDAVAVNLIAATVMNGLVNAGFLHGEASVGHNREFPLEQRGVDERAWATFTTPEGEAFVVDVVTGYVGPQPTRSPDMSMEGVVELPAAVPVQRELGGPQRSLAPGRGGGGGHDGASFL